MKAPANNDVSASASIASLGIGIASVIQIQSITYFLRLTNVGPPRLQKMGPHFLHRSCVALRVFVHRSSQGLLILASSLENLCN